MNLRLPRIGEFGFTFLATCLIIVSVKAAAGPHDDAIKARQALMRIYDFNVGILSDMAKEKVEYDAAVASDAAANLLSAVSMKQGAIWPMGSDSETEGNRENRALPTIWTTYPKIMEPSKAMHSAAVAMEAVAGDGLESLQSAMRDVTKSCSGCHNDYRAKRK